MGSGGWTGDVKHARVWRGEQPGHLWRRPPREMEEGSRMVYGVGVAAPGVVGTAGPGPGRRASGAGPVGPGGVEGAFRGPSPGDKGPAAPRVPAPRPPGAAVAARPHAYLGHPSAQRRGLRVRSAAACSGARSAGAAARGGGSSSRSGRLSLRLSVSHRGGEGGGAKPPEEGPAEGAASGSAREAEARRRPRPRRRHPGGGGA